MVKEELQHMEANLLQPESVGTPPEQRVGTAISNMMVDINLESDSSSSE